MHRILWWTFMKQEEHLKQMRDFFFLVAWSLYLLLHIFQSHKCNCGLAQPLYGLAMKWVGGYWATACNFAVVRLTWSNILPGQKVFSSLAMDKISNRSVLFL